MVNTKDRSLDALEDWKFGFPPTSLCDASASGGQKRMKSILTLEKPESGKLYFFDREILPVLGQRAYIFGRITVIAAASDGLTGISKVEFFLDNTYKTQDTTSPYQWIWDENSVGSHTIKVVAYDGAGNKISKEIEVVTFNPL